MQTIKFKTSWLIALLGMVSPLVSQTIDSTGLPGDHFSLDGALDLLKKAESPEAFEKLLNTEDTYVNNVDLNEDGDIDYIRVIDHSEDDAHVLVIQAVISKDESQDIAVIEIEKTGDSEAILQIIGDEDLFGEEVIIEPFEEEPGKGGPDEAWGSARLIVNVWLWPSVRHIYRPEYRPWVSPWRWKHYPTVWRPWRVHPFHWMLGVRPHYHLHYHPVHIHRVARAHRIYVPRRATSTIVHKNYGTRVTNYRTQRGITNTKKTTILEGPRGGKTIVQQKEAQGVKRNEDGAATRVKNTETKVAHKNGKGEKMVGEKKTTKVGHKDSEGKRVGASRTTTRAARHTSGSTVKAKKSTTKAVKKTPRRN
ncbi:MAG: hypothetical protein IPL46_32065 [Saprospiraceae bacterium]|nr:hypothetical protein [Saprospiraceae bacterium]